LIELFNKIIIVCFYKKVNKKRAGLTNKSGLVSIIYLSFIYAQFEFYK